MIGTMAMVDTVIVLIAVVAMVGRWWAWTALRGVDEAGRNRIRRYAATNGPTSSRSGKAALPLDGMGTGRHHTR